MMVRMVMSEKNKINTFDSIEFINFSHSSLFFGEGSMRIVFVPLSKKQFVLFAGGKVFEKGRNCSTLATGVIDGILFFKSYFLSR